MTNDLFRLHQFIVEFYTLDDLKTLCFRLIVRYDDLGDEKISTKVRELILLLCKQHRLDELLTIVRTDNYEAFELKLPKLSTDPNAIKSLYTDLAAFQKKSSQYPELQLASQYDLPEKEQSYLKTVASEWSTIHTYSGAEIPLSNVYVTLQVVPSKRPKPTSVRPDILPIDTRIKHIVPLESNLKLDDAWRENLSRSVSLVEALRKHQFLVILGEPGSGKSTTLQFIALDFATEGISPNSLNLNEKRLPFLVSIKNHIGLIKQKGVEATLAAELERLRNFTRIEALTTIQKWRHTGKLIILFDGLDEVSSEDRLHFARALRVFNTKKGATKCRVLVASRTTGYQHDLGSPFKEFMLKPFEGASDAIPFVANWLTTLQKKPIKQEQTDNQLANAENLVTKMTTQSGLNNLLDNPLLLQLSVETFVETKEIVNNRFSLYAKYIEVVAVKKAHKYGVDNALLSDALPALQTIAWKMHCENQNNLLDLETILKKEGFQHPHALLDMLREKMGLLVYAGTSIDHQVYFTHLTFQEFFVARRLRNIWVTESPDIAWSFLRPRLHHPSWREPIFLLAHSLSCDVNLFIKRILTAQSRYEKDIHRDLDLAAKLVGTNIDVEPELIREILKRLTNLISIKRFQKLFTIIFITLVVSLVFLLSIFEPFTANEPTPILIIFFLFEILFFGLLLTNIIFAKNLLYKVFVYFKLLFWIPSRIIGLSPETINRDVDPLIDIGRVYMTSLLELMEEKDPGIRRDVAISLGIIGDAEAVPYLLKNLERRDDWGSIYAAIALGNIGHKSAIPGLLKALRYKNKGFLRELVKLAEKISNHIHVDLSEVIDKGYPTRVGAAFALGEIGGAMAVPGLIAALRDPNYKVRGKAADVLGEIGAIKAIPGLIENLNDRNDEVRRLAIQSLGKLKASSAVSNLFSVMNNPKDKCRGDAAWALSEIGNEETISLLSNGLRGQEKTTRIYASLALTLINKNVTLPNLNDLSNSRDVWIRMGTAWALGNRGDSIIIRGLFKELNNNLSVR